MIVHKYFCDFCKKEVSANEHNKFSKIKITTKLDSYYDALEDSRYYEFCATCINKVTDFITQSNVKETRK